jgi:hypothetical protein
MLLFGTISTVTRKVLYDTDGKNIDGTMEAFSKPWWTTLIMFIGESTWLLIYYILKASRKGVIKDDDPIV